MTNIDPIASHLIAAGVGALVMACVIALLIREPRPSRPNYGTIDLRKEDQ